MPHLDSPLVGRFFLRYESSLVPDHSPKSRLQPAPNHVVGIVEVDESKGFLVEDAETLECRWMSAAQCSLIRETKDPDGMIEAIRIQQSMEG